MKNILATFDQEKLGSREEIPAQTRRISLEPETVVDFQTSDERVPREVGIYLES